MPRISQLENHEWVSLTTKKTSAAFASCTASALTPLHRCALPTHKQDDVSTKFAALSIRDCKELVDEGVIAGGMIPKAHLNRAGLRCRGLGCVVEGCWAALWKVAGMPRIGLGLGGCLVSWPAPAGLGLPQPRWLPPRATAAPCPRRIPASAPLPARPPLCAGGLLHPVSVPGGARHPHHRRPPAALAAHGAAHR